LPPARCYRVTGSRFHTKLNENESILFSATRRGQLRHSKVNHLSPKVVFDPSSPSRLRGDDFPRSGQFSCGESATEYAARCCDIASLQGFTI
jgi:hypothetical protein